MQFSALGSLSLGIIALLVGKHLKSKWSFLRKWSIPDSVAGGMLFAAVFTVLYLVIGTAPVFELRIRDILLVYFFTAVGLNADARALRAGGLSLAFLIVLITVMICVQNGIGVSIARAFGLPAAMGVIAGSVSLLGGHGTAIGWGPTLASQFGVENAERMGVSVATAGLVMGSVLGGPVARFLIALRKLEPEKGERPDAGISFAAAETTVDYISILRALLALNVAVWIGLQAEKVVAALDITLPSFVTSMLAAILLTNTVPHLFKKLAWPAGSVSLAILSELSLGIFLGMSLMSLELWSLAALAIPILVILLAQAVAAVAYSVLVVFPVIGRDYDSAVVCGGFIAMSLGALLVALASMTAVTREYGAAHRAFIIVPLAGAFFIDIANSILIGIFAAM